MSRTIARRHFTALSALSLPTRSRPLMDPVSMKEGRRPRISGGGMPYLYLLSC